MEEWWVGKLVLGVGWGGSGGLVSGSGESVCLGNISGEGFQGGAVESIYDVVTW